jgi:hypothetical protein
MKFRNENQNKRDMIITIVFVFGLLLALIIVDIVFDPPDVLIL